jgi:cytochrome c peroxidase
MRGRLSVAALGAVIVTALTVAAPVRRSVVPDTLVDIAMPVYARGLTRLDRSLARLDAALAGTDAAEVRRAFRDARAMYKRIEPFAEYYASSEVRALNGVPLPKAEDEDPETPLRPIGLQVVETIVFPTFDTTRRREGHELVSYMRAAARTLAQRGIDSMPGDAYVFDAMRHEVARVSTLGIAGFDATASGDAITESAEALEGVREALEPYRPRLERRDPAGLARLDARLAAAVLDLRAHGDFERFDRLAFLANYAVPLARALASAQHAAGIGAPAKPRAWSGTWSAGAGSLFDEQAIDPHFFASTDAPRPTPAIVELGRHLFFDPRLSPSRTRSCATCHVPERAFADGRPRAELLPGHGAGRGARNTPTLINAALQPTLFADGRVRTLEDQATDVLGSASEMGGSLALATAAVRLEPRYRAEFVAAFGGEADSALSQRTLRLALAAYVRSLTTLRSPFDRAVRGDSLAMSRDAENGFNLFMGKARCGTCHFAPLFGGAMPPTLTENEPEVIGVPVRLRRQRAAVDPDSGRFNVRRIDQHLHAFKTPTLRNIALTAPYMHNGVFPTLESVVDFYDVGGGAGIGVKQAHQTLPTDSLHLTRAEKGAIVAFLRALTDTAGTTARPRR